MPLPIAEAPSHLSRTLLLRVDRNDDMSITLAEVDAYASQPFVTRYESSQLADLRQAVLGRSDGIGGRRGAPEPDRRASGAPEPREESEGWFQSAIKWLGDLGDSKLFQGALMGVGIAGLVGWFAPPVAAIAGFLGFLTSASSILSGLINEDREVNWWQLPIGLLHASGTPFGLLLGGGLGLLTVRDQS